MSLQAYEWSYGAESVAAYWGPQNVWNTGRSGPETTSEQLYVNSTRILPTFAKSMKFPSQTMSCFNEISLKVVSSFISQNMSQGNKKLSGKIPCLFPALHRHGSAIFTVPDTPTSHHQVIPHTSSSLPAKINFWKFVGIRWPQALDMKKLTRGPNLF